MFTILWGVSWIVFVATFSAPSGGKEFSLSVFSTCTPRGSPQIPAWGHHLPCYSLWKLGPQTILIKIAQLCQLEVANKSFSQGFAVPVCTVTEDTALFLGDPLRTLARREDLVLTRMFPGMPDIGAPFNWKCCLSVSPVGLFPCSLSFTVHCCADSAGAYCLLHLETILWHWCLQEELSCRWKDQEAAGQAPSCFPWDGWVRMV